MTTIIEIERAIEQLPKEELFKFENWFSNYYNNKWDQQIADDATSGKLNSWLSDVKKEIEEGKYSPL